MGLSVQALAGIVIAAVVTAVANVMIRAGIERFGGFSPASVADVAWQFLNLLLQPLFFVGFLLYFAAALVWFRTIAIAPLTVAYPLMVSLTFILVTLGAMLLWGEPMTVLKLVGLIAIILGIALVSASAVPA
jgi:multidrug transporter EmrE-like cation transporter